jgi:hypothetical protein
MASPTQNESGESFNIALTPAGSHAGHKIDDYSLALAPNLPVPLHINKVIVGELQNALASMKLNARWADLSRATKEAMTLYNSLVMLKNRLENGVSREIVLPVTEYLSPFLDIVTSEIANGPITSIALSSILKFMQYGYLDMSNGIVALEAMESVVTAAMKCKFEALGSENDAVVMFKILKVLQKSVELDTALLFSDQIVYDMVQTCFKLSIQGRVSNLLRKCAEMALTEIFQFALTGCDSPIKARLIQLHIPPEIAQMINREEPDIATSLSDPSEPVRVNAQGVSFIKDTSTSIAPSTPSRPSSSSNLLAQKKSLAFVPTAPPFGVACLIKLLRFLCTMINPKDPSTSEPMRYLGLTLVNFVLELRGESLAANKRLMDVVSNDVCRHLIQSVRSEDGLSLLSIAMRICNNLFSTSLRSHLGFQLDLFLRSTIAYFPEYDIDQAPKAKGPGSEKERPRSFDQKELALDVLVQLCRDPTFAVDLIVNYDCHLSGPNLFDTLVKFFENINDSRYEHVDADPDQIRVFRAQSHTALSSITVAMSNRLSSLKDRRSSPIHFDNNTETVETPLGRVPSVVALKSHKALKNTMKTGAEKFNAKPKEGLDYLIEKGALPDPVTAKSVASLFRTNPFISKSVIGEYFGVRKDFNTEVLKEYALSFDWSQRGFFEHFREFLESFRIPGEAPVIEKILDTWTRLYYQQFDVEEPIEESDQSTSESAQASSEPPAASAQSESSESFTPTVVPKTRVVNKHPMFKTLDSCYLMAMSVVLLNVDMYNPNVKANRRMNIDQYVNNLRGQNGKENFPPEFLRGIYTAIRASEIKVVEEHMQSGTAEIPQGTWQSMWTAQTNRLLSEGSVAHQKQDVTLKAGRLYGLYDELIFGAIWKVMTATTKQLWQETHFSMTETITTLSSTFYAIGHLGAHFNASVAFDALIAALTDVTTILQPYKDYSFEVRFSQDKKAQIATSILFGLAHLHTNVIREGWKSINDMMIVLQSQSTLPPILDQIADDSVFQFKDLPPPLADASPLSPQKSNNSSPISSMFSSLWKWGSGAAAAALGPVENSDDNALPAELERYRNSAKQILIDCHLPDMISACSRVDPDSLLFFMQVLILGSTPGPSKPVVSPPTPAKAVANSDALPLEQSQPIEGSLNVENREKPENPDSSVNASVIQHPQPQRGNGSPTNPETLKPTSTTPTPKVTLPQGGINAQTHRRLAPRPGSKNRFEDSVALYCVDMLAHLALLNAHRVDLVWPIVANHFSEIIRLSDKPTPLTESSITNLLVIVAKLLPVAIGVSSLGYNGEDNERPISVASHMCHTLQTVLTAPVLGPVLSKAYSHKISHAMRVILRRNVKSIGSASSAEWQALLDAVCANMMDTAEHMENLIDVISSSLVKGVIPASLATSAQAFTSAVRLPIHATDQASTANPSAGAGIGAGVAVGSGKMDLQALASSTLVSAQNIRAVHSSVLKLLMAPGASLDALVEGMESAQALLVLGPRYLPVASEDPVWHGYLLNGFVIPIFAVLAQLAHDARIVVRQTALSQLQKAFCSPGLSFATSQDWILLFQRVLLPLLDSMLSPPDQRDSAAATAGKARTAGFHSNATKEATEEAFLRAMAVLSKTYLHCMAIVNPLALVELWRQVLFRYASFYKNPFASEVVQESATQSVKNTLSVMHSSGILLTSLPPAEGENSKTTTTDELAIAKYAIWTESWPIVDQFAPTLRKEFQARTGIAPPAPSEHPAPSVPVPSEPLTTALATSENAVQEPSASSPPSSPSAVSPANSASTSLNSSFASIPGSPSAPRSASPINPPGTVHEL